MEQRKGFRPETQERIVKIITPFLCFLFWFYLPITFINWWIY